VLSKVVAKSPFLICGKERVPAAQLSQLSQESQGRRSLEVNGVESRFPAACLPGQTKGLANIG
jgi:hypothetical protein